MDFVITRTAGLMNSMKSSFYVMSSRSFHSPIPQHSTLLKPTSLCFSVWRWRMKKWQRQPSKFSETQARRLRQSYNRSDRKRYKSYSLFNNLTVWGWVYLLRREQNFTDLSQHLELGGISNIRFCVCIRTLIPILHQKAKRGTPHQAKQAIHCIHAIFNNKEVQLAQIFEVSYQPNGFQDHTARSLSLSLALSLQHSWFFYLAPHYFILLTSWFSVLVLPSPASLCHVVWMPMSPSSSSLRLCLLVISPCWPQTSLPHQWSRLWPTSLWRTCWWMTGCVQLIPFTGSCMCDWMFKVKAVIFIFHTYSQLEIRMGNFGLLMKRCHLKSWLK